VLLADGLTRPGLQISMRKPDGVLLSWKVVHKIEPIKRVLEKATGIGIPDPEHALARLKAVRPRQLLFRPDGYVPNNPSLPLLLYVKAIRFERGGDPAGLLEAIFNANGWGQAWRNGIYDFVHYHPRIHEVLGVARGIATLRLGGNKTGTTIKVGAGDVVLIPAGVGHECLSANTDFLVVGAYPPQGVYSECRGSYREYEKSRLQIARVPLPKRNPLFGSRVPVWRGRRGG
jgi:uncharacterized protein YjlB